MRTFLVIFSKGDEDVYETYYMDSLIEANRRAQERAKHYDTTKYSLYEKIVDVGFK